MPKASGLHRTTVEFERQHSNSHSNTSSVCIEPRWNLNDSYKDRYLLYLIVCIEPRWNLNAGNSSTDRKQQAFASNHGGI